ncbi:bifunctional diguanylate cyclase/phosphodiesterase [Salinibius halmophilus]|uniref:bifunctional diguanylate cyclase/phosphodiesterase n=1 Tax=Salinibius halmophilus TaxID=1853216 RepID=UPI001314DDB3|nr:EAL domain-containing protein [Salinibius halmophilus]
MSVLLLSVQQRYQDRQLIADLSSGNLIDRYGRRLQMEVDRALSSAYILRGVARQAQVNQYSFSLVAQELYQPLTGIRSLQLAPNGVVTYAYPQESNQPAIGHNLMEDPETAPFVQEAILDDRLVIEGPKQLKQGGMGVIARLPIFIDQAFWGVSVVVFDFPDIVQGAELEALAEQGYDYTLWHIVDDGEPVELLSSGQDSVKTAAVTAPIAVGNHQWQLSIAPVHAGWVEATLLIEITVVALISILFAEVVRANYRLMGSRRSLKALVSQQTFSLSRSESRLLQAQEIAKLGSWEYCLGDTQRRLSKQAMSILSSKSSEEWLAPKRQQALDSLLAFRGPGQKRVEYEFLRDGQAVWVREIAEYEAKSERLFGTVQDITQEVQANRTIWRQANVDELTGLANRNLLVHQFEQLAGQTKAIQLGLLVVDVDNFKGLNSGLGSDAGDAVLKAVAERLQQAVSDLDILARFSGDEFVICVNNPSGANIDALVSRIRRSLEKPIMLEGVSRFVTVSGGISRYPDDSGSFSELHRLAKIALLTGKDISPGRFTHYLPQMLEDVQQLNTLESELKQAIRQYEIFMVYQPIVSASHYKMVAIESLARWQHSTMGSIPPDRFITIAEQSGTIIALGEYIAKQVGQDLSHFPNLRNTKVAINISRVQFIDEAFATTMKHVLEQSFASEQPVVFEITESALHNDAQHAQRTLGELLSQQVSYALDDFGTGYSSFISLKQFPVSNVKIDRSFVTDCPNRPDNQALLTAIVAMAHALGFTVTAEGVETVEEAEYLRGIDCDFLQGYYFSKPCSLAELVQRFTP